LQGLRFFQKPVDSRLFENRNTLALFPLCFSLLFSRFLDAFQSVLQTPFVMIYLVLTVALFAQDNEIDQRCA